MGEGLGPALGGPDPLESRDRPVRIYTRRQRYKRSEIRVRAGLRQRGPGQATFPIGALASLTSCSESVPDSFLSLPLLPVPPFFLPLLPGFRPLREGTVHLPRGLLLLFTPQPPPTLWPWPSPPRYLVLGTHLRGPLSPSMWLSSPSPCMSGTDATKSFKKSNCCSSSMHCFLEEAGEEGVQREHTYGRIENSFCVS